MSFLKARPPRPRSRKNPLRLALGITASLALWAGGAAAQTWTPLKNSPPLSVGYMVLATDGSVLAHARTYSADDAKWYKLTPDSTGSYVNGTWSQIASMPSGYAPIDTAGGVLADGKVLVEGGEYNDAADVESNLGAIYDPVADSWTSVPPPAGWDQIGDASGVILANGTFMMGQQGKINSALFDESHLSWTITGTNKPDYNVEENWILLPNNKVLNVEVYWWDKYNATGTGSELFDPSTGSWSDAGSTIVQLWDSAAACGGSSVASAEIGPMVLRPDGTVLGTGANACGSGHSAIYHTSNGTWTVGPDFPNGLDFADAPAAVETNGKVLMMASPGIYQTPPTFLEWDGTSFTTVASPSGTSGDSSWYGAMLELPSGQILFSDLSTTLQVWTPAGTYQSSWQPTINSVSSTLTAGSQNNAISGTQFNGLTQGAYYGDDQQMASNYPLVRIVNNATGTVTYCRTHDHSSMGVATGSATVSTNFDIPANIPTGASMLYVVANGIPSAGVAVNVGAAAPGFSLTATTATVTAGSTGTSTVTEAAIGGFTSPVSLAVSGLPSGVTASFSPASITGSGTAKITFSAASNVVPAGGAPVTSSITLTGTAASGAIRTTKFYLTLVAAPSGTLSWNVANYNFGTLTSIANSYSANVPFTLTNTGSVAVSIKDVSVVNPGGEFNLNGGGCSGTLAAGANCTVFVYFTPSNQSPGTFTGSLVATDSALNSPQTVNLSGTGAASGFNVSANDATVAIGGSASTTVTQVVQGGFNAPVTLSATQVPAGVTVSFSPSTLSGAGTSTMTFSASSSAAAGSYGVMIVGTSASAGITQVYTTTLKVTGQSTPTFSLSASPATVTAGSSATASVTESVSNGFNTPVALSASSLPAGVSASFSPASITGAGSSTVTFSAAASTTPGTYTVTVTGAPASGTAQSTTLSLTVKAAASGSVSLSPSSFNFGNVGVGSYSNWQQFTLTNTGSTATSISSVAASGPFSVSNQCGSSLAAGANCTIWVIFGPAPAGASSGTLTVTDSASNSPQKSQLSGSGGSGGAVTLSPSSLSFGSVLVGSSSTAQQVTVTNGTSGSITVSSIAVTSGFAQNNNCGTLAAGGTCTINAWFVPKTTGAVSGTLSVSDSASGSAHTVGLGGTGLAPTVALTPASYDFGSVVVNGYSSWQAFTVSNSGSTAVSLGSAQIKISSGQFSMTSYCGSSLAAGGNCTIWVLFGPTATGAITGELEITAGGTALDSQLSGTGTSGPAGPHEQKPPVPEDNSQPSPHLRDRDDDSRAGWRR